MTNTGQARTEQVRATLASVTDPELDESVVELGFITGIEVQGDAVNVKFRLPTYWCAANFSYLMASDMRDAVAALPWAGRVSVVLDEHMFVDAINDGVAAQKDFAEAFPAEANADLAGIRLTFGLKSFERRQEALLRHLLARGLDSALILGLDVTALERLGLEPEGAALRARYLQRRPLAGNLPAAFVDRDGAPIMQETLTVYLRNIRRVGLNAEFNGALCRGLLAVRYGEAPAELPAEPGLIDFLRMAPPGGAPPPP
jgi:metal-sulfur cluster biosynthetic enzyme